LLPGVEFPMPAAARIRAENLAASNENRHFCGGSDSAYAAKK
jgi:hypothetical protein